MVLSAPARQLLAELTHDGPDSGYVFPAPRPARGAGERPYGGLKRFWDGVRKRAKLGDTRIHDLRHTHASVGVAGGFNLLLIGKLLGHSQASTTERYAHLADDPVRQAADAVGNRIAAALAGKAAEVVPLHPGQRAHATQRIATTRGNVRPHCPQCHRRAFSMTWHRRGRPQCRPRGRPQTANLAAYRPRALLPPSGNRAISTAGRLAMAPFEVADRLDGRGAVVSLI